MNFLINPLIQGTAEPVGVACTPLTSCGIYIGSCDNLDPGNCGIWVKSYNL
jgi:hypothetical protein